MESLGKTTDKPPVAGASMKKPAVKRTQTAPKPRSQLSEVQARVKGEKLLEGTLAKVKKIKKDKDRDDVEADVQHALNVLKSIGFV